jgi:DNA helicase II / ATP-dependent DNA helicase PcrA
MNIELSDQAQLALDAEGPVLVLGGPGSGKTTLALLKAQRIIPTLLPGQEVLFLSFSRAAVRQVMVRCREILVSSERRAISVKTYHAFCMELLKSHGRLLTGQPARIAYPAVARLAKSTHHGDWAVEEQRLAREEGLYCFDQFAPASVEILTRAERVLRLINKRYPVIILDEFQDTDDAQWDLVKLLSQGSYPIVLADPDQRIFEYDTKVDPERLNQLRTFLQPAEFDLGGGNHRSPDASILSFADAVLRNRPLVQTSDVVVITYWGNSFHATVHAYVTALYGSLVKKGIRSPTVAVLCRSNPLVADVSGMLSEPHTFNGRNFPALDHHVVWDAELTTAAAQVVASILEWPQHDLESGVATTLHHVTSYYDLKNAVHPSNSAHSMAESYRAAEAAVREGRSPRLQAARQLVASSETGLALVGRPETDWLAARAVVAGIPKLKEVFTNARFVRLFRARDEIGGILGREWLDSGTYGPAADRVRRTLEARQLTSANTEPSGVVLMTMHKSKGKEFDGVVIVEGQYSGRFFGDPREQEPFEATRRLLRVAITRARHRVCIIRPRGVRALTDH